MYRLLLPVVLAALMSLNLTGCSGELYLGTRRIDRYEQTQSMTEKPAYCHFFNCPEVPK